VIVGGVGAQVKALGGGQGGAGGQQEKGDEMFHVEEGCEISSKFQALSRSG